MLVYRHFWKVFLVIFSMGFLLSCGFGGRSTKSMERNKEFVTGNRYKDFNISELRDTTYSGMLRFDASVTVKEKTSFLEVQNATIFSPRSSTGGNNANVESAQIMIPVKNTSNRGYCSLFAYNVVGSFKSAPKKNILGVQGSYGFHFSYSNFCLGSGETGYILAEILVGAGNINNISFTIDKFSYSKLKYYQPDTLVVPSSVKVGTGREMSDLSATFKYKLLSGNEKRDAFLLSDPDFYKKNISKAAVAGRATPIALFFNDNNQPIFYAGFYYQGNKIENEYKVMEYGDSVTIAMGKDSKVPFRIPNTKINKVRIYSAFSTGGDKTKQEIETEKKNERELQKP